MPREFDNFGDMAKRLLLSAASTTPALHYAVRDAVKLVAKTAKAEIGVYQDQVVAPNGDIGFFPAWAQLAESTERDKEAHGYPLDSPLLRTGEFRDGIKGEAQGLKGIVGSDADFAYWHEMGTEHMPPRPVFGPAGARNEKEIQRLFMEAIAGALIFADTVHKPTGSARVKE